MNKLKIPSIEELLILKLNTETIKKLNEFGEECFEHFSENTFYDLTILKKDLEYVLRILKLRKFKIDKQIKEEEKLNWTDKDFVTIKLKLI